MATASTFPSEDQFLCSICLDVFTEPVSTPCGHNFCKACLSQHWDGKEQCQCPLCNEKFSKGLKICVNTGFREVVENFKKHYMTVDSRVPVTPDQVLCDSCLGNQVRASKTCLVCLASFCKIHLEPHLRVSALKRHKLTSPVQNLEDKICKEHCRILEFFCLNDQTRVCAQCTEHSTHDIIPLVEESGYKEAQRRDRAEVQEIKQKGGQKMRAAAQRKRKGKFKARAHSRVSHEMPELVNSRFPSEGPHSWSKYSYIPGLSEGRFFFEVQIEGKGGWEIGVVTESARRKGASNCTNGKWIMRFGDCDSRTLKNIPVTERTPEKVTVFVDYENGMLCFFDGDNAALMCIITGCKFEGRLFLVLSLSHSGDVDCFRRAQTRLQSSLQQMWQQFNPWYGLVLILFCSAVFDIFL